MKNKRYKVISIFNSTYKQTCDYMQYVWYVHPYRVYYGLILLWYIGCVVYNICTAEAIEIQTVAQVIGGKFCLKNIHYAGIKTPCLYMPYNHNIETYQHVQQIAAVHISGLHDQGWEYVPVRRNKHLPYLADAMLTNGTELLPLQYKAIITGRFNANKFDSHILNYGDSADILKVSCLRDSEYDAAIKHISKLVAEGNLPLKVLVSLINLDGCWQTLTLQQREYILYGLEMQKTLVTNDLYNMYNDAMDAHTAAGGTPTTLFTFTPDVGMKTQVIKRLAASLPQVGLTYDNKACLFPLTEEMIIIKPQE